MEGPRERERESARARDREGQEGRGGTTLRLRSPQPPNHPSQAMVGLFLKRTINSTIIIGIGDELLEARPMRLDERRGKPSEGREKVFYRNDDLPAVTRSSHLAAETFRDPPSPSCRQLSLPPLVSTLIPSQTDTNAPLPPTPPASTCTRGRARWNLGLATPAVGLAVATMSVSGGEAGPGLAAWGWTVKRLAPASRQSSRQSPGDHRQIPQGLHAKNASFPSCVLSRLSGRIVAKTQFLKCTVD